MSGLNVEQLRRPVTALANAVAGKQAERTEIASQIAALNAMPAFQARWAGGFEEAWRQHLIQESARCAPGLHGAKPTIYARSGQ